MSQVFRAADPGGRSCVAAGGNVKPGNPLGGAAEAAAAAAAAQPGDRRAFPAPQRVWVGRHPGEQQAKARRALRCSQHPGGDDASHYQLAGRRGKPGVGASGKKEGGAAVGSAVDLRGFGDRGTLFGRPSF